VLNKTEKRKVNYNKKTIKSMAMNGAILGGLIGAGSGYLLHRLFKTPDNENTPPSSVASFWCVMGGLLGMCIGDSFCTQTIYIKHPGELEILADKNVAIIFTVTKTTISS
jgi:hypothetical protein